MANAMLISSRLSHKVGETILSTNYILIKIAYVGKRFLTIYKKAITLYTNIYKCDMFDVWLS